MNQEPGHREILATAHRPFMNLDDDFKDVHIIITSLFLQDSFAQRCHISLAETFLALQCKASCPTQ